MTTQTFFALLVLTGSASRYSARLGVDDIELDVFGDPTLSMPDKMRLIAQRQRDRHAGVLERAGTDNPLAQLAATSLSASSTGNDEPGVRLTQEFLGSPRPVREAGTTRSLADRIREIQSLCRASWVERERDETKALRYRVRKAVDETVEMLLKQLEKRVIDELAVDECAARENASKQTSISRRVLVARQTNPTNKMIFKIPVLPEGDEREFGDQPAMATGEDFMDLQNRSAAGIDALGGPWTIYPISKPEIFNARSDKSGTAENVTQKLLFKQLKAHGITNVTLTVKNNQNGRESWCTGPWKLAQLYDLELTWTPCEDRTESIFADDQNSDAEM